MAGQSLRLAYGRGAAKAASFLGFVLVARALGPARYGGLTFALALASLLVFIPNMGVDPYFTREVASGRANAKDLIGPILVLKTLGSIVFLFVYVGVVYFTEMGTPDRHGAVLVGIAMMLLAFSQTWSAILVTSGRAGVAGVLDLAAAAVFLVSSVTFVRQSPTVTTAAFAFLAAQLVVVVLGAVVVLRYIGTPSLAVGAAACRVVFQSAFPLMMIWFLSDVYLRIDMTIMHYLLGDGDTGLYAASYRLIDGVAFLAALLCAVSLPRLSKAVAAGPAHWRQEWRHTRRLLLFLVTPFAVILFAGAGPIITFVYGARFIDAAHSLRILGPASALLGLGSLYGAALTSVGLAWAQFWITAIALAINVALNFLWIPLLAGPGSAAATLTSALVFLVLAHNAMERGVSDARHNPDEPTHVVSTG